MDCGNFHKLTSEHQVAVDDFVLMLINPCSQSLLDLISRPSFRFLCGTINDTIDPELRVQVLHAVMDMVIFRTNFFELLVFFTFTLLTLHFAY